MLKRSVKFFGFILGAVLVLAIVAIVVVATFDWNRVKPWLSRTVAEATGRSVSIDGELVVSCRHRT
jgi:uncharacterized protein involved in outer membrane biogenesis